MLWTHKVNPDWLEARRNFLTASDIMKLLPTTPTGRPRAGLGEAIQAVWAKKQCKVTDDDVTSSGVMARGHLLEPYAVTALNLSGLTPTHFHHWDDCLIYSKDGIACSPDGLDIARPNPCMVALATVDATEVLEVKCYNGDNHYACGMSGAAGTLPERWQIATAMYVMPSITSGTLAFFNPSAKHPLFVHRYSRADLAAEFTMIESIGKSYESIKNVFTAGADTLCGSAVVEACPDEEDIIAEILEAQAVDAGCLNP